MTIHIPLREVRAEIVRDEQGEKLREGYAVYLNGALRASELYDAQEAQLEADLLAWYEVFSDSPLTTAGFSDEAVCLAHHTFCAWFTHTKVHEKAKTAVEKIIEPRIYCVEPNGELTVMSSSTRGRKGVKNAYRVTACKDTEQGAYRVSQSCECPDFYMRAREHGGLCKHIVARMLLHLAQRGVGFLRHLQDALGQATTAAPLPTQVDPTPESITAFITVARWDLQAALYLAHRTQAAVTLHVVDATLSVRASGVQIDSTCVDGEGTMAIEVSADDFTTLLYEPLRLADKVVKEVNLFIASDSVALLSTLGFNAVAPGTCIPTTLLAPEPTSTIATASAEKLLSEPVIVPVPFTPQPTVDALQMLFQLLEEHEPAWYQRKHYRVAQEGLKAAGIALTS